MMIVTHVTKIQVVIVLATLKVQKEKYNGMIDPTDHITCFESTLDLYDATDDTKCRMFPNTLQGMARSWYDFFPAQSIFRFNNSRDCL